MFRRNKVGQYMVAPKNAANELRCAEVCLPSQSSRVGSGTAAPWAGGWLTARRRSVGQSLGRAPLARAPLVVHVASIRGQSRLVAAQLNRHRLSQHLVALCQFDSRVLQRFRIVNSRYSPSLLPQWYVLYFRHGHSGRRCRHGATKAARTHGHHTSSPMSTRLLTA